MKRYTIGLITLLLIVGCSKPINEETLIDKEGLKYNPDTKELYSGKVFANHTGIVAEVTEYEGSYKDGKKDGEWNWYNMAGQRNYVRTYKDGKLIEESLVIQSLK